MIREENTIYIIQYDYDLDGKILSIPSGCTLWFQGGTINNGTIYLQDTAIMGIYDYSDIGNVNMLGTFKTGQLMTMNNEENMPELRWWSGNEWKTVCN